MPEDERPVPLTLRVAAEWCDLEVASDSAQDGVLMYRERALLTGDLSATLGGRDVTFSDLGVYP